MILQNVIKSLETFCVAGSQSSIGAYKIFRISLIGFYFFYEKFILKYFYLFVAKTHQILQVKTSDKKPLIGTFSLPMPNIEGLMFVFPDQIFLMPIYQIMK